MDIQSKRIDEIIPYARNPRKNNNAIDYVMASIKEFGFRQPIVIDEENVVVVGHTRLLAAKKLGLDEVPVHVVKGLTPQQIKAYRIADNKTAEYSEFDDELLVLELGELKEANYDLINTGFDSEELDLLLEIERDGLVDDDAVPIVAEEPVTKLGDLYILGNHKLLCGDATDKEAMKQLVNNEQVDLVWVDPPYNVNYQGGALIKNDNMDDKKFRLFLYDSFTNLYNITKIGCPIYVAHADMERLNFQGALVDSGFLFKQNLIWVKTAATLSRGDYNWQHEPFLYGWKPGAAHKWYGDFDKTTVIDDDLDLQKLSKRELKDLICEFKTTLNTTVMRHSKPYRSELHPTTKPVSLVKYMIKNSTKPNDIIIDSFGGSGSTLIACEKTNRKCYMMELDEHYCDVIVKRWEDYTGNKAQLESK